MKTPEPIFAKYITVDDVGKASRETNFGEKAVCTVLLGENVINFYVTSFFFFDQHTGQTPERILTLNGSKDVDVPFGDVVLNFNI